MASLQERVRLAIERDALVPPGSRVVAAVSGGSDSVALLLLLLDVAGACAFTVAGVAHVNHGLRGAASDRDEAFCRALSAKLGVAFEVRRRDVARLAHDGRVSREVAARHARYECLAEMAERLTADVIATGHTRDDQAETFLLRLLRGAGASGLSGIRPRLGHVVRPLLDIRRHELLAELAGRRQAYRTDSTNRDVRVPRNWVRHRLLPMLARQLNADVVEVLARDAAVLRDEAALLDQLSQETASRLIEQARDGAVSLDARGLADLAPALARRVVRLALDRQAPSRFRGFDHVEQVLAVARADRGRPAADLPGVRVERNRASVVLYNRGHGSRPTAAAFRYELAVPGRTDVPECGCAIDVRREIHAPGQPVTSQTLGDDRERAIIDAAAAGAGLAVRSRRPGDWIRPLGLRGSTKLQDVLVNRKVPRSERDRVPLVVDAHDDILWVAGHVVSQDARVTDRTRSVVVLKRIQYEEEGDEA
ncbi:MAG: tRNA lysidine(34) synthetase TilS [Vicinamibacterales bacterium]